MDSQLWIDSLSRCARAETLPELRCVIPRIVPAVRRLPRLALSLSAVGSLATACLVLALGLHAQHVISSSSSTKTTASDSVSVLFAPLQTESDQP